MPQIPLEPTTHGEIRNSLNTMMNELYSFEFTDTVINSDIPVAPPGNEPPLDEDYVEVCTLNATGLIAGLIYVVTVSFIKDIPDTNDGMYFKFVGDTASPVFFVESQDQADIIPFTYTFPITQVGTTYDLSLEACMQVGGTTDGLIPSANIMIDAKG